MYAIFIRLKLKHYLNASLMDFHVLLQSTFQTHAYEVKPIAFVGAVFNEFLSTDATIYCLKKCEIF